MALNFSDLPAKSHVITADHSAVASIPGVIRAGHTSEEKTRQALCKMFLLLHLNITRKLSRIVVHPTCPMIYLGIRPQRGKIASSLAVEAEAPVGHTCCGTAGDRGLLHPELVMSATSDTKAVPDTRPADAYISANRTFKMGLLHATGRPYQSFVFLLEELSRPERRSSLDGA